MTLQSLDQFNESSLY